MGAGAVKCPRGMSCPGHSETGEELTSHDINKQLARAAPAGHQKDSSAVCSKRYSRPAAPQIVAGTARPGE